MKKEISYMPQFLISVLFLFFEINFAQSPVIEVWYGSPQRFGHLGTPQKQINILGRISDPQGIGTIDTLWYTLNGSPGRRLNWGDDGRRLEGVGDFNIEIFLTDSYLNKSAPYPDTNEIIITVTDANSNTDIDTVIVELTDGITWSSAYSVAWDTGSKIQNVVQITDGKWSVVEYEAGEYGIRPDTNEYGYDRALILGDTTWENYEITIKTKIIQEHPITGGVDVGGFFGFVPRWTGHSDNPKPGWDPKAGWEPSGEFTGFNLNNAFGANYYKIGNIIDDYEGSYSAVEYNTQYYKMRIQSDGDSNFYAFKWWKTSDSEPSEWILEGRILTDDDAENGCILLLAHNMDAVFGDLTISPLAALPVELVSFRANATGNSVTLNWETATELNNYGFEIERVSQAQTVNGFWRWETRGFVNGFGTSSNAHAYSYIDKIDAAGKYFYRLKQIDNDGSFEYSPIVEVFVNAPSQFSLAQNYPNPFNPITTLQFNISKESLVKLQIYNSNGELTGDLLNTVLPEGTYREKFDAQNLSSGVYFYVLTAQAVSDGEEFRQVKKMTLLK